MAKVLQKIIKIDSIQVCKLGDDVLCFKNSVGDVWEQYIALDNAPSYAPTSYRPLVYFVDDFLNSHEKRVKLKRLKAGIYQPK